MARAKKDKVDYFPHMVTGGKTIFILEQKFGNDGYAFWFKLLELLGDTKGHYFCTSNYSEWHFLIAKTRVTEQTATEILDTLAELNAIDADLWKEKMIWVQKFVDNISDVYKKRKQEVPEKPISCDSNNSIAEVPVPEMRQSKVKESKVKESKGNYNGNDVVVVNSDRNIFIEYEKAGFGLASSMQAEMLMDLEKSYGYEMVADALKESARQNVFKIGYAEGILKNWKVNGRRNKVEPGGQNKESTEQPRRKYGKQRTDEELDAIDVNDPSII